MLVEFRDAIYSTVAASGLAPVHPDIPDDVAELPCVVVGMPASTPSTEPVVVDLTLAVYAVGRRSTVDDPHGELTALADALLALLGGTRGASAGDIHYSIAGAEPGAVEIAGLNYPTYTLTVETNAVTC